MEAFLERETTSFVEMPKGTVWNNQLKGVPKPTSQKSPEKLKKGFEVLQKEGFCEISDIEAFVNTAFVFQAPYQKEQLDKLFHFRWKKANSFIDMMDRLRDKRSIGINHNELVIWLEALLPHTSRTTIEKNLWDKDKKPSKKFRVDIQVFE